MSDKTMKQKINEFLCKYAQSDYTDEYGNTLRKLDGKPYKSGRVTAWDALWNLILVPILIILMISVLVSLLGGIIGDPILSYVGININIFWLINPLIKGLIIMLVSFLIIYVPFLIHEVLTVEIAKCPIVEIPPERKRCEKCGAPLPFENEKIEVEVKNQLDYRSDLGNCDICKAPKLYEKEEFKMTILSYSKPKGCLKEKNT